MLERNKIKYKINVKNYKNIFWVFLYLENKKTKSEMKIKWKNTKV